MSTRSTAPNYVPTATALNGQATPPAGLEPTATYAGAFAPNGADWTAVEIDRIRRLADVSVRLAHGEEDPPACRVRRGRGRGRLGREIPFGRRRRGLDRGGCTRIRDDVGRSTGEADVRLLDAAELSGRGPDVHVRRQGLHPDLGEESWGRRRRDQRRDQATRRERQMSPRAMIELR